MQNTPVERWLPYPNFAGFYEVSDQGNVCSLARTTTPGGLLKPRIWRGKYRIVTLCKYGIHYDRRVARMVLETFVGPCPPGHEACHGPDGPLCDWLSNLCWGTYAKNQGEDRVRDGTSNRGEQCGAARLTEEIVLECRRRYAAGEAGAALAREFGVTQPVMSRAISGKTWAHVPGPIETPPNSRQAKLTDEIVVECRRRYAAGESQTVLAAEFGVVPSAISQAVHGRKWANLDGAIDPEEDGRHRPRTEEQKARSRISGRAGARKRWGPS